MLDNLPAIVLYLDNDYRCSYANKKCHQWLGLPEGTLAGKHLSEIFHQKTYSVFSNYLEKISGTDSISFESEILLHHKGQHRFAEGTITINVDDERNIIGYFIYLQDITEKKRIQKALELKNKELQDYVDHGAIGLHWVDENGIILWANRAEMDLLGYTREEYIGHHISEFHASKDKINDILNRLTCNETLNNYESELRCKDGSIRTVHISSNVYREQKKFIHTRCFTVDVTEEKKLFQELRESEARFRELTATLEKKVAERTRNLEQKNEELRKSEERYHKMVEEVEDYAIILLDRNGIIQNWNKGAEKIKGYKEAEIVGKSFRVFYLPEDREKGLPDRLIKQAAEKGKALHEGWRVRKDGSSFWGSIVLTAFHDEQGGVIGFSKVTRDLTERKMAEEKMKKYTQELEFQNKELEQFAYVASHDMKEPLRKVIFYNSIISESAAGLLSEKQRSYLQRSISAAQRMQLLIDDLLTYSKTTLPHEHFERVDLNEILMNALLAQKEVIEEKKATIERQRLPVMRVIRFQMQQLFDNLLSNALKYHHRERTPVIQIRCEIVKGTEIQENEAIRDRNYYKISFIDNGIGFDPAHADKIFELFQRLKGKNDATGTGIGLAICRRVVQNHGGFMQASGQANEGAQFDFYLPSTES